MCVCVCVCVCMDLLQLGVIQGHAASGIRYCTALLTASSVLCVCVSHICIRERFCIYLYLLYMFYPKHVYRNLWRKIYMMASKVCSLGMGLRLVIHLRSIRTINSLIQTGTSGRNSFIATHHEFVALGSDVKL